MTNETKGSPEAFLMQSLFKIADKDGREVPFVLNPHQLAIDQELSGRDIIPKARQLGVSTYVLGRFAAKCLTQENRRCVIISHQAEATRRLLARIKFMLSRIEGAKPMIGSSNMNEISFKKTNSVLYIGTAGNQDFAVGDTITNLHASECSRWQNPAQLLQGLFQAIPPSGEIIIESTGHGVGNWFHKACLRAASGQGFKLHFLPWNREPAYQKALPPEETLAFIENLDPSLEEEELFSSGALTIPQLAWRRDKIVEMDYSLQAFKEQYPLTLDECFQADGATFFTRIKRDSSLEMRKDPSDRYLLTLPNHPKPGCSYVIGADISGGVGRDNSVAEILCLETLEQVAEWANNRTQPDQFAEVLFSLSRRFNGAMINPERNALGLVVVSALQRAIAKGTFPRQLAYREKGQIGTQTTMTTKPRMIAALRNALATEVTVSSPLLLSELQTFIENDNKLEAQVGCFDDRVMALAMAVHAAPRAALLSKKDSRPSRLPKVDPALRLFYR